jgi:Flp pilus assembly protein TadB
MRYENLFVKSIEGGKNHMERFGKSRKIRTDEFLDSVGYIRRLRHHDSGPSFLSILFMVLVVALVYFIISFWKIILMVLAGIGLLIGAIFLFIHLVKRNKEKRRQVLIWR